MSECDCEDLNRCADKWRCQDCGEDYDDCDYIMIIEKQLTASKSRNKALKQKLSDAEKQNLAIKKAVIDFSECLDCGEGVSMEYYLKDFGKSESIETINSILTPPEAKQ